MTKRTIIPAALYLAVCLTIAAYLIGVVKIGQVSIRAEFPSYPINTEFIKFLARNETGFLCTYGTIFYLEYNNDGDWIAVDHYDNYYQSFIAFYFEKGTRKDMLLSLDMFMDLKPGQYRCPLVYNIKLPHSDYQRQESEFVCYAEFELYE